MNDLVGYNFYEDLEHVCLALCKGNTGWWFGGTLKSTRHIELNIKKHHKQVIDSSKSFLLPADYAMKGE